MTDATTVGAVARLWRYPVKSLLGEPCDKVEVDARGIEGDRVYAIRDAAGKIGSGKNTRRFRQIDGLLSMRATYRGMAVEVQFPDGGALWANDPSMDATLSAVLGQPVALAPEGEIAHFDAAAVHVLSSASLAWLRAAIPDAEIDERRFRANIVLDVAGNGPVEQHWVGKTLRLGDRVELRVTMPTERCAMVSLPQRGLSGDPRILRQIIESADLLLGVYAEVTIPGTVRRGDAALLID